MSLAPGTRLGAYEILSLLGSGGMGEVYKARDTRLGRTVAVKILAGTVAEDPHFRERFDREARAISRLTHPHICTLYDVGRIENLDFLVMEFIEGETLASRLAREPLPFDRALQSAVEIVSALDAAHRAGIVHRDLKPGNIMLEKSGAKLLDFGLAKLAAPDGGIPSDDGTMTRTGVVMGTVPYMAPEQIEGSLVDARTDLFACGAVIYEMFTGRRAFSGATQASLVAGILRDTPTPMQEISPNVPEHVTYIVETCLAKDPEDRWQTARDLLRELRRVTDAPRTATRTSAHRGREAAPTATRPARILALATVTAAAVSGLAVWGFSRSREQTPPASASVRFQISTPETSEPFSLALSPDGRQLAYVGMSDGAQKIWVRGLDQTEAAPLRGTDGAMYPFWSSDGKSLGFFADGKLKRVDVTGGEPLVLATAPIARGGSWSRSGVIVFAPTVAGGLQQVPASGGNVVAATKLQTNENSHRWPQFIDDRRFLFQSAQSEGRGLFIASLDDGKRVRVSSDEEPTLFVPPNTLLVVRRGALFSLKFDATRGSVSADPVQVVAPVGVDVSYVRGAFTAANDILAYRPSAAERRTLVWLDRTGKVLETIGAPDDNGAAGPDLTSDGRRLVEQRTIDGNTDLWLLETDTGVLGRFTFDDAFDTLGIWSGDTKHVYFLSSRNRTFDIFEKLAGGGEPERPLLRSSEAKSPTSVSPDGTVLIYQSQSPKTGIDILGLPIRDPDPKPFPIVQTDFDEMAGQLSPDGRWLAYQSNASGRMEVRLRQFGGTGIERQVSTAGGSQPRWARNGKELFYVTPDGWLTAVPIQAGADVSSLVVGAPHPLFKSHLAHGFNVYPAGGTHPQYAVAPDGRFLAVMQVEGAPPPPVIVVTNALPR